MGLAAEVITSTVTNPGATVTATSPNAGDSLTVRNADPNADIFLIQDWSFTTTNLLTRIRSPRMHDSAQNMRFQPTASQAWPLMPWDAQEKVYPQDPITVELTGGAAEVDMNTMLLFYQNIPGIAARLHGISEIHPLIEHLTTVEVDITSSATSCAYSPTVALNATFDTLIRNRDYALLGYQCATNGGTLGIRGADTGNLRLGGPITNLAYVTDGWFVRLNESYGYPTIPVFNSGNVASILCDIACQAVSTVFKIGFNLALLKQTLPMGQP